MKNKIQKIANGDHRKIELTPSQAYPGLADPEDFHVTEQLPLNGTCGDSPSEYRRLLRPDRDNGKSKSVTPLDEYGRRLAG